MSLTFLAKSSAYSWKMSFCGQVLCQRIEIGPWALTTIGKPRAAAPVAAAAALLRNRRRGVSVRACASLMSHLLLVGTVEVPRCGRASARAARRAPGPRAVEPDPPARARRRLVVGPQDPSERGPPLSRWFVGENPPACPPVPDTPGAAAERSRWPPLVC